MLDWFWPIFKSNEVRARLAYLAAKYDQAHRREDLAARLWEGNLCNPLVDLSQVDLPGWEEQPGQVLGHSHP